MNTKNVGVIGLGAMGLGIARSLLRSGFNVHACDVRTSVTEAFAQEGGVACESPAAMAAACDVIVTVVVNAEQTETVLVATSSKYGTFGMYKVAALDQFDTIITDAALAEAAADGIRKQRIELLLAPVGGKR